MAARGYVGVYAGNTVPFFVPARFLSIFRARKGRIVREARPDDGESERIVPLISIKPKSKAGPAIETKPATGEVESVDTGHASETSEKRGRRGVRTRA